MNIIPDNVAVMCPRGKSFWRLHKKSIKQVIYRNVAKYRNSEKRFKYLPLKRKKLGMGEVEAFLKKELVELFDY